MNISIMDSNRIFSEALSRLFKENGHDIVSTFTRPSDLLHEIESLDADILIADFDHCGPMEPNLLSDTYGLTKKLKVIALSADTDTDSNRIEKLLNAGVMGYISKSSSFKELLEGVEKVGNGHHHVSADLDRLKPLDIPKLTPQEKRVLILLIQGHSAKEIAEQLKIAVKTVYIHRARIIQKFGTKNLISLKTQANRAGIA
jgi:DNA-binding NarL/FixJ family response regulator